MNLFVLAVKALGPIQVDHVDEPPTFSRDIAPIVFENCIGCHRAGGSAPFSLETASAGRFDRAVRTAEKALAAARDMGDAERMQGVAERLELYRNDTPYRAP